MGNVMENIYCMRRCAQAGRGIKIYIVLVLCLSFINFEVKATTCEDLEAKSCITMTIPDSCPKDHYIDHHYIAHGCCCKCPKGQISLKANDYHCYPESHVVTSGTHSPATSVKPELIDSSTLNGKLPMSTLSPTTSRSIVSKVLPTAPDNITAPPGEVDDQERTETPTTTIPSKNNVDGGLSNLEVTGIVAVGVFFVGLFIAVVIWRYCCRNCGRRNRNDIQNNGQQTAGVRDEERELMAVTHGSIDQPANRSNGSDL